MTQLKGRIQVRGKSAWLMAALLLAACGSTQSENSTDSGTSTDAGGSTDAGNTMDGGNTVDGGIATVAPTVLSNTPADGAVGVYLNGTVTATFSKAMDLTTLTASTFLLNDGSTNVSGAVTADSKTATFTATNALMANTKFTATLTVGCKDGTGVTLAKAYTWSFTTGADFAPLAVTATRPLDGAVNVWSGQQLDATFNDAMDQTTLTTSTFTVRQGTDAVMGRVSYDPASKTATFTPANPLNASLLYTATISTGAKSASGLNLANAYSWSFTTHAATKMLLPVDLRTAGHYVILAETKISTVPKSAITGDIAISPAAATFITGFGLTADSTNTFSTSKQIKGQVFAADYASPTPSNLTTAIGDMGTAFADAAGRPPDVTELGAGKIGGMTLAAGVYKWGSGLLIPTDLHLNGSATDVWIFEIAQKLNVSNGTNVVLSGGALPKNVFWQVSGSADFGTTSHFEGVVLCQTAISLRTGASINGRLLAQSAVTLDSSTIVEPAP
jgi:hypothetical protein